MGTMSVSLVDVSNPRRKEEGKTDRRKEEREEGSRPQEALLMRTIGCWGEEISLESERSGKERV